MKNTTRTVRVDVRVYENLCSVFEASSKFIWCDNDYNFQALERALKKANKAGL